MCARQRKCSNTAHRKGILRKQRSNMSNEKCTKESRERFRGDISRLKVGSHTKENTNIGLAQCRNYGMFTQTEKKGLKDELKTLVLSHHNKSKHRNINLAQCRNSWSTQDTSQRGPRGTAVLACNAACFACGKLCTVLLLY